MLIKLTSEQRRDIKKRLLKWYRSIDHNPVTLRSQAHRTFYSFTKELGLPRPDVVFGRSKKPNYSSLGMKMGARRPNQKDIEDYRMITDGADLPSDSLVTPVLLFDNDLITDRFEVVSFNALKDLYTKYVGRANDYNHDFSVEHAAGRLIRTEIGSDETTELHMDYPKHAMDQLNSMNPFRNTYMALWGDFAMPNLSFDDTIERIEKGVIKDVSIAFNAPALLCSECLKEMQSDMCFTWCDEHGFPGGRTEEGRLVVGIIDQISDAFTFGLVSDGAIKRAGIVLDPFYEEEDKSDSMISINFTPTQQRIIALSNGTTVRYTYCDSGLLN